VTAGTVTDLQTLEWFLRGRLRTAGLVAAGLAAAACAGVQSVAPGESAALVRDDGFLAELDAEADARTPAPAQREASRRQGRALLRAARVVWPEAPGLASLAASVGAKAGAASATASATGSAMRAEYRAGPHHAIVLGAAAAAAGCAPAEAARIAAYQAVAGPVSAAVRLLALDPMRATGILAGLASDIDQIAAQGAAYADSPPGDLPCASAPALDLLAETHIRAEVRLFES
jgi:urease accessory protein